MNEGTQFQVSYCLFVYYVAMICVFLFLYPSMNEGVSPSERKKKMKKEEIEERKNKKTLLFSLTLHNTLLAQHRAALCAIHSALKNEHKRELKLQRERVLESWWWLRLLVT